MNTFLTVQPSDLGQLSPDEAVDVFRELLWAEATTLGISKSDINVPTVITAPDGGIDAEVQAVQLSAGQGIIKQGITRYQIKIGPYSLREAKNVKEILFKKPVKGMATELKPRVKSCFDNNGTLVVVLFGWDNPETQDDELINNFKEQLQQAGLNYSNVKIEIFQQNKLIGFLKPFPALALKVNRRERATFQTHKYWSKQDDMRKPLKLGDAQQTFIADLTTQLRRTDEAVHIRICGEPGIGKTRLVLEATREDDLQPLVIYCDAKQFEYSLLNEILRNEDLFAILVLDECDSDTRAQVWNKLKHCGHRIKLVSIFSEFEKVNNIIFLDVPVLSLEQISAVLQEYTIPKPEADRWAHYCDGSPRVAHVFGWNLKNNPQDLFQSPDTVNVWDRFIAGEEATQSSEVKQRHVILQYLALFKRFGFGQPVKKEAAAILKIINKDESLTWPKFQRIIDTLKKRKILQGEYTLYITPKMLHIKLWVEWWETYGDGFDVEDFAKDLPEELMEWFYEMFVYADESQAASKIVKHLLGPTGPFQNNNYLQSRIGGRFFLALTNADPRSALTCLQRTIGTWAKERLTTFKNGRREVVWALERIVIWRDLFTEAAELLLVLAEAENESYGNNATGIFIDLFPVHLASTEASSEERFPVLKRALQSQIKERRLIAMKACDKALTTDHFSRMVGAEYQGLRKEPQLWKPKIYNDLFDNYRRVWRLLHQQITALPPDEQQQAVDILFGHIRGLSRYINLLDMIMDTIKELAQQSDKYKKRALARVMEILHYTSKDMPADIQERWNSLKEELTGSDFSSLLKRYVGMDLLVDKFDEKNNYIDQAQPHIKKLAQDTIENPTLLLPNLPWLVTTEAHRGFDFGYELGNKDTTFTLLPQLLNAQRKTTEDASTFFLGGYFCAIAQRDRQLWEQQLDTLVSDSVLYRWIPELSFRSGLTDQAGLRILDLAERNLIAVAEFRMFCYASVLKDLSENIFRKWLEFLLKQSDWYAIFIAMDMCHFYYLLSQLNHSLPMDLALQLLLHPCLFQKAEQRGNMVMGEFHWTSLGKAFVHFYPEKSIELAERILQRFGEGGTILDTLHSKGEEVLNKVAQLYPKQLWNIVTKYLEPWFSSQSMRIQGWLQGDSFEQGTDGALSLFIVEDIFAWVEEDAEQRATNLATLVPKLLSQPGSEISLARELLVRYGEYADVRSSLMANFSSEGWSGPASEHYQYKKQWLLSCKQQETNEKVIHWINEYLFVTEQDIEWSRIREERHSL